MRTLILTCNTGEGHNSTARAILETYELNGEFCEIRESFSFLSKRLSNMIGRGHATMYRHIPKVFDKGYALSEKHDSAFATGSLLQRFLSYGNKKLHRYVIENDIDNIICVHPFSAILAYSFCEKYKLYNINLSIVATDYTCAPGTTAAELDAYFVPHERVIDEFVKNGISRNRIFVSGIPVKRCFYVNADRDRSREILKLPKEKQIIVMCCGSMGCGPIEKIGRGIAERLNNNQMLIIICGSNKRLYARLSDLSSDKVRILGFTRQMNDYMGACNLFITKPGGISTTECANMRVPMMFVNAVAGCELHNREFFESIGGAFVTDEVEDLIEKALAVLDDGNSLEEVKSRLAFEFNMTGAQCIYETLLRLTK